MRPYNFNKQWQGNAFGLYDMHGNVSEWCADQWYNNYKGAPTDRSAWILHDNDNHDRVLRRGGSWNDIPYYCRSAYRIWVNPDIIFNTFGFRVVCVVSPGTLK